MASKKEEKEQGFPPVAGEPANKSVALPEHDPELEPITIEEAEKRRADDPAYGQIAGAGETVGHGQ